MHLVLIRDAALLAVLLSLLLTPALAKKKPGTGPTIPRVQRSVEIPDLEFISATQKCDNWAWAAGVELALHAQGVSLKQNHWVARAHGGELCVDGPVYLPGLVSIIQGEYQLDERRVRLEAKVVNGVPTVLDDMIVALRRNRPLVIWWNGRAFVLYGITYDEHFMPGGQRMFEVRQLKLADPLGSGEQRFLTFEKGRDHPAQINGTLDVTVSGPR